jgi:hypothetical protein
MEPKRNEVWIIGKEVAVRAPHAIPRQTAYRRVLLGALKVHVEQKHEDAVHLWGTRLQNQKVRESWRRNWESTRPEGLCLK